MRAPSSDPKPRPPASEESAEAHDVIPARAVLTELARGFLLVRDSDPRRAARFAATFLKERAESAAPPPARAPGPVTPAFASLGPSKRGPIDHPGSGRGP